MFEAFLVAHDPDDPLRNAFDRLGKDPPTGFGLARDDVPFRPVTGLEAKGLLDRRASEEALDDLAFGVTTGGFDSLNGRVVV